MEAQIGVAKIKKYATSESGDSLEVIERPNGGLSVVLADGQRSGRSAKRISNIVVRKVISLLAEGVRDGPAARAASDYLYSMRNGKVMATLNIISLDLETQTLVLSRNNPAPIHIVRNGQCTAIDEPSKAVGVYRSTRPNITELPLDEEMVIAAYTDGITNAGVRKGMSLDMSKELLALSQSGLNAQKIADAIIEMALELDEQRPVDDVSIVILRISQGTGDQIRRMTVALPLK